MPLPPKDADGPCSLRRQKAQGIRTVGVGRQYAEIRRLDQCGAGDGADQPGFCFGAKLLAEASFYLTVKGEMPFGVYRSKTLTCGT